MMRYSRCKTLFKEDFKKLQNAKILILGVGGVGGYALDCLYRSGISNITIVDYDIFEESNLNRQLFAENIGKKKVEVFKEKFPEIKAIDKKIDKEWVDEFDFSTFDFVLDCIDDIGAKIAIIKKSYKNLISSMGSAKRIDPLQIKTDHIWNTKGDRFAKKIKEILKKQHFNKKFQVVYSNEPPLCKEMGSFVGVTGSFGLVMCSIAVKKLLA